jgi:hypothetical protein
MNKSEIYAGINTGILGERARALRRNCARNLKLITRFGGLARVVDMLAEKHAIVVGAGPSLERAIPELRRCFQRPDVVLIAADMALRPLLAAGIRPHFAISCETTPVPFFQGIASGGMHLLAFSCMSHRNLSHWQGDISFYNWMIKGEFYEDLWREAGEDLGYVATGSVVLSQAVSIALGCAIRSLALTGNDLGFRRSYYARGAVSLHRFVRGATRTIPAESAEFSVIRANRMYEIRREGALFHTNHIFLSARMWFEELFKSARVPIYDSSEPGVSPSAARKLGMREYREIIEKAGRR